MLFLLTYQFKEKLDVIDSSIFMDLSHSTDLISFINILDFNLQMTWISKKKGF